MKFNTMVNDITIEDGRATAVTLEDGTVYEADEIVSAVGREGADWFSHICNGHGIEQNSFTIPRLLTTKCVPSVRTRPVRWQLSIMKTVWQL